MSMQRVDNSIQTSHPLSLLSLPAFKLSQHQYFPVRQFYKSGGQSIRTAASVSILPMNIHGLFLLGLTGLTSLLSKELKCLLQHHSSKASILQHSAFFMAQLSHPATGLEKVSFHPNPKERQCKRMFKLTHNCTHLTCC